MDRLRSSNIYAYLSQLESFLNVSLSPSKSALEKGSSAWNQGVTGIASPGFGSSAFGSQIEEVMANNRKTTPPMSVTESEILREKKSWKKMKISRNYP